MGLVLPDIPPDDASDREWALYLARRAEANGNPVLAAIWRRIATDQTVPDFSQPEL